MLSLVKSKLGRISQTPPEGTIILLAAWAIINSMTIMSGDNFAHGHPFEVMREISGNKYHWGALMFSDSLFLSISLFFEKLTFRVVVAALSCLLWLDIGFLVTLSAYNNSTIYTSGSFDLILGLWTLFAGSQWLKGTKNASR